MSCHRSSVWSTTRKTWHPSRSEEQAAEGGNRAPHPVQGNVTSEVLRLLDELEVSFGHLPTPPSRRIVVDNDDLECQQIREKLGGHHWRDLAIDDLAGESDALSFLTPEAFRFYLPAFIRVSLTDPFRADLIPDAILSALGIPEDPVVRRERERELTRRVAKTGLPAKALEDLLEEREPALETSSKPIEKSAERYSHRRSEEPFWSSSPS